MARYILLFALISGFGLAGCAQVKPHAGRDDGWRSDLEDHGVEY